MTKILINQQKNLDNINKDLNFYEFKVFSQFGDDGIIQFLINNLEFENKNKNFLEFGIEDYSSQIQDFY